MNPEAIFDVLCILDVLRTSYRVVHITEVFSLCYLAQLLSVFDGNPMSNWGYSFAHHDLGGPYSSEIADALDILSSSGYITDIGHGGEQYELKSLGATMLSELKGLFTLSSRTKYLTASGEAALSRPLPLATNALLNEPMLQKATCTNRTEILGSGPTFDILYEHFEALKKVLGPQIKDVWLAALLWLDYLNAIDRKAEPK